jgi:Ca2+:H+ antiporter
MGKLRAAAGCPLVAVVGLAKVLSPSHREGGPRCRCAAALVGSRLRCSSSCRSRSRQSAPQLADRLQTSLNLAFGSALATIGLTVPVVVATCIILDIPLVLGLDNKDIALLALTFLVSTIGRLRAHQHDARRRATRHLRCVPVSRVRALMRRETA